LYQLVRQTLNGLPRQPHGATDVGDGLRRARERESTKDLPARTGQPQSLDQLISCSDESAVQLEDFDDEAREALPRRRPVTMARRHDSILSKGQHVVNVRFDDQGSRQFEIDDRVVEGLHD
jgi:hypothetical protein